MNEPSAVHRRRRLLALALLASALVAAALAVRACVRQDEPAAPAISATRALPPARSQLPGGGRRIFPDRRVVAFYGAPQSTRLGALGIGRPEQAGARLLRVARRYDKRTRPVLPAFELIATIATAGPGDDGQHRTHQPDDTIDRYLRAARRIRALLVLDIQPGRGDFLSEAQRLEDWLREPDVGLALDPEWHVAAHETPGQVIGSVTAGTINRVSAYLARLVRRYDLPQKLFVVHQFTSAMIERPERVAPRSELAITINADGFGDRPSKVAKYEQISSQPPLLNDGFKLFYEEDTTLMSPRAVLALRPPPDLVVYE